MIDLRIEWHSPDACWVAVFMRQGEPWFLNGALVGFGSMPPEAVDDLLGQAQHLIIHGENGLTQGSITMADRCWLFAMLDLTNVVDDEMYKALRNAGAGERDLAAGRDELMAQRTL